MTTTNEIKKSVERQFETLTPQELAKYFMQEMRRIIEREVSGEDVTGDEEQLEANYNKYVFNRDIYDYAAFWRAMHLEEREHWGRYFLKTVCPGVVREQALTGLLILEKMNSSILLHEALKGKKRNKKLDKYIEKSEKTRETLTDLLTRYKELTTEIIPILESDTWDQYGIERPYYGDIEGLAHTVENMVEDFILYEDTPVSEGVRADNAG
jgi:hypothetical protein